jgi:Spy/CpxP family protein refolding chaperone
MKKITLALTAVVVGLLLTSQAFAWGPGSGRGNGYCRDAGLERLNLTDDQKGKIEVMRSAHEKASKPLREKIYDKAVELRRLWLQASPDKDKITAAQKEIRVMRDDLQDKATALRLEIRKVLTPEQNEKLANMHWGKGPGFGPRGGMRGEGEQGRGSGMGRGMCQ